MLLGMFPSSWRAWVHSYLLMGVVEDLFSFVGGFWGLRFAKAAMSLGQSPLATSCGVGMSEWTVPYGGVESHDGGLAIM